MVAFSKIIDLTKDDDEEHEPRKRLRTMIAIDGVVDGHGDDRDGADGADDVDKDDKKDDKGRVVIVIDDDDDDDQQVDGAFPAAAAAAVHGGYLRDEASYDDLRDAISHKRLSVKASNGRYAQRTLLLGMYHSCGTQECYTVDKPGQGYRDLLRCQALENVGYIVHTCDNKHTEEFVYKKRGRRKKEVPVADRPGVHLYHRCCPVCRAWPRTGKGAGRPRDYFLLQPCEELSCHQCRRGPRCSLGPAGTPRCPQDYMHTPP